jgi:hypothetical protein
MDIAPLYERELVVVGINSIVELTTGDLLLQVSFGEYIDATEQVVSRLPAPAREAGVGKKIGINWVTIIIKGEAIPYQMGSKWKLTVEESGEVKVTKAK